MRAGFVTQAILNGVPEHVIMAHTGHKKSDTLKKYIRETNKWKNNAAMRAVNRETKNIIKLAFISPFGDNKDKRE